MRIHYFQRYHQKENVATANTMLLLSRLYSYSSDKFFRFLKSEYFLNSFEPEIVFRLQEKSKNSIPDATITQEGFKIVVETKMTDWFNSDQLMNHLESFGEEKNKVLITLSSEPMEKNKLESFKNKLEKYNEDNKKMNKYPVIHINTTFELMANAIGEVIDERDYEMQEVLEDYLNYCYTDGLIPVDDSWKYLRMQLAGVTFDFNIASNVYYDKSERGFRAHDFIGLYKQKSIKAIGKVCARITAIETSNGIEYNAEFGELTDERKKIIQDAILDGDSHGYDLRTIEHRYFFVEKFYKTDFKKISPGGCMGSRIFDLTQLIDDTNIQDASKISERLNTKTWS